ncbi:hypothetical protein [Streptomyces sp. MA5143a]|uniref:hypothetical protein n=1 Tax=Streptomyces sp. MA5143a TaxID=2083010 RepID=UPI002158D32A|nr:hypothetical protein [Streptomyces sp. MA5143a]
MSTFARGQRVVRRAAAHVDAGAGRCVQRGVPGVLQRRPGGLDLLTSYDLNEANNLLETAGLTVEVLPPLGQFLFDHVTGRWDQALESARRLLANNEIQSTPVSDNSLMPARTAAILLARGRVTSALQINAALAAGTSHTPQRGST